jgi:hypothetical protein
MPSRAVTAANPGRRRRVTGEGGSAVARNSPNRLPWALTSLGSLPPSTAVSAGQVGEAG